MTLEEAKEILLSWKIKSRDARKEETDPQDILELIIDKLMELERNG